MDIDKEDRDLFIRAVEACMEGGVVSASLLQRKTQVSYQIAEYLIEAMSNIRMIGPSNGNEPREILITKEKWGTMKKAKRFTPILRPSRPRQVDVNKPGEANTTAHEVCFKSASCPNCGAAIKNPLTMGIHICDFCGGSFTVSGIR